MRYIYPLLLLVLLGCQQDIVLQPLNKTADLTIVDQRFSTQNDFDAIGYLHYQDIVPLIPYWTKNLRSHLTESFVPDLQTVVQDTEVFTHITTMENDITQRKQQNTEITIYIHKTKSNLVASSYGLGFAGFVFYILGAPSHYQNASIEMEIEYKQGEKIFRDKVSCSTTSAGGIYYDSEYPIPKALQECMETSLSRYLKQYDLPKNSSE